jgi:hypothetical protein
MSILTKAAQKAQGIFYKTEPEDQRLTQDPNTEEQQRLVDMALGDWEVFKPPREQMHDRWAEEQRFYNGDHWFGLRTDAETRMRPNAKENIFFSQIESIVGKLCGWTPVPDFQEQEDGDKDKASALNDFIPQELKQIRFREKYKRAVRRAILHGPLIFQVLHDPDYEGGRGNYKYKGRNDIAPVDLYSFYPDPRITDFIELQRMSAIIVKPEPRTMEYIRKRWPDQGVKVQPDNTLGQHGETPGYQSSEAFNRDLYGGAGRTYTGTQTAEILEYWYRGLPKVVTRDDRELFRDMADMALERGADPAEYAAKAKGDMDGIHCIYVSKNGVFLEHKAYVYDHGQYPFVARTLYPEEGNIWGKGMGRDMIQPQIFLNKYSEIVMETMSKQGNSAIMYEEGAITKPRTWQEQRSMPGAMLPVAAGRMNSIKELEGVNVPSTAQNMQQYYQLVLQKIPGQFDSSNGAADSRVTSGEQAKALIAAAGTRLNTVSDMISEELEEVFLQYIELACQFYTDERIARVNGRRVSISRASLVSSVPTEYIPVDDGMDPEQLQEPQMDPETGEMIAPQPAEQSEPLELNEEFVPEFDIRVNIGVDKPQDREYWMQLAFNMMQMMDPIKQTPMIDAEAVRYTVQTGRMETMDVIQRRIDEEVQQAQQTQQSAQQLEQLQAENQQLQQALQEAGIQLEQMNDEDRQIDRQLKIGEHQLKEAKVATELMKNGYQAPPLEPTTQQFDITQGSESF